LEINCLLMVSSATISIVIPTRNRRDVLGRLVTSIALQDRSDLEAIIIDDASENPVFLEDLEAAIPLGKSLSIKVARLERPSGACTARNRGIAEASGRYVLFVDDDIELHGNDLCSRLLGFTESNPSVGVVALAELTPNGKWGLNLGPNETPIEVSRFYGCGALFRAECLNQTGGFFEPLGYYYEEFEISMRVIDKGWRMVFHPEMRIIHYRDPRGRDVRGIRRLISRNALLTAIARFPAWMLPAALLSQLIRFTLVGWRSQPLDLSGPFAVIKATMKEMGTVLTQRNAISTRSLRKYKRLAKRPIVWITSEGELPPESLPVESGVLS
jgi:GT2 family glycosyltransferase